MSIHVENLSYIYSKGTPQEHLALDNLNFNIYDGEIIGIIGHTGSGKSTLLQHLNGLLKPSNGKILLNNKDITKPGVSLLEIRKHIGLVFQYPEYQLFEDTCFADIAYGPRNLGLPEDEIERRVQEAMELVSLDYEDLKDRSPFELSGGQKRRVAIAGVISMKPDILILDEPTAGLDPKAHREILQMVKEIHKREKNIIIFVSHNMRDVANLSDRVMVLSEGKLVMMGSPEEVFFQGDRLKKIGLSVPPITELLLRIKEKGGDINTDILTIDEAEEELVRFLREKMKKAGESHA